MPQIIEREVEEFIDEGDDTPEEKIIKQRKQERSCKPTLIGSIFNPIALALHPVQQGLAPWVPVVRQAVNFFLWKDRVLTFLGVAACCALILLLSCIPWAITIYWAARLVSLTALECSIAVHNSL